MRVLRIIILLLCLIGLNYSFGQQIGVVTLSDDYPKAGKAVNVNYEIIDSSLMAAKNITARVYYLDNKNYPVDEVSLEQVKTNRFKAEIVIPDSTKAFVIKIEGGDIFDNNAGVGFVFLIYDKENPVKGGYAQVAYERMNHTSEDHPETIGLTENIEVAVKNYEKEFSLYPPGNTSTDLLRYYFALTRLADRSRRPANLIIREKIALLQSSTNEDEVLFAAALWRIIRDPQKADSVEEHSTERFSHGKLEKLALYHSFFRDSSTARRASAFDYYIRTFPVKDEQSDFLAEQTAVGFLSKGKFDEFNKIKGQMKDTAYLIRAVNNVADGWAREGKYLPQAESLAREAMEIAKRNLDGAVSRRYMTIKQVREIYQHNYDSYCSVYNYVLCREGRVNEALKLQYPLYKRNLLDGEIARNYALILIADNNYTEARNIAEASRTDYLSFFGDILKVCYVKQHGSEKGYKHYSDSLAAYDDAKQRESYIRSITVNKPAPSFTIVNLENKAVSLSYFKGKTVVIAFWASWQNSAIPYTAALNEVKKKFSDNYHVVFLFVNTWAEGDRSDEINKFVRAKGYHFNVLVDKTPDGKYDTVVKLFGGIDGQSVYIIDRKGNIRINGLGYFGDSTPEGYAADVLTQINKVIAVETEK